MDYEQCSAISDAFKDRYTFHAGMEKTVRRYTYRAALSTIRRFGKGIS